MTARTTYATITFEHSFSIKGFDAPQAPGTYTVRTDEELIEGLSFSAYARTSTAISIPLPYAGSGSVQLITTDPRELEAALAADRAQTAELATGRSPEVLSPPSSSDGGCGESPPRSR